MDPKTERALIEEILGLREARTFFLEDDVAASPVERYLSPERFERERERVLRRLPSVLAHASELPQPHSFVRRELAGLPVLLTRDGDGEARAFLNVCRHRGMRLVEAESGCKRRFSCPYHAWTYDTAGALVGVTHGEAGFPGLDRDALGLRALACVERHGWIWVAAEGVDVDAHLADIEADLAWLDGGTLTVAHVDEVTYAVNWKILIEGGIESYHFRVAHAKTIGPHFLDTGSTHQRLGSHLRNVLPRRSLLELAAHPEREWRLRDHANLVYTLFPNTQLLVQQDHLIWFQSVPLAPDRTRLRLATLVPAEPDPTEEPWASRWAKNHAITRRTLDEDFAIGEGIQAGLASGANAELRLGRYEGAIARFNRCVEDALG